MGFFAENFMKELTPEQENSLVAFELERQERCARILARYEKPIPFRVKHTRKPWTNAELKQFQDWGCIVTVTTNKNQQTLF